MQPSDLKMWQASRASTLHPMCNCLEPQYDDGVFKELTLHSEVQDTSCEAWKILEDLIETAASKHSKEFAPGIEMPRELWSQIITLPSSISKLISLKKLYLYGSFLVRIPQEIGELINLEELDLYTSYRLHWLPFEVTRCPKLKSSRFSTRALYGNYKYRPPFPKLGGGSSRVCASNKCSVCGQRFPSESLVQVWTSLRVATDVLPLLVNACSKECILRLPPPAYGYVDHPHPGGLELFQPPKAFVPPHPDRKWSDPEQ